MTAAHGPTQSVGSGSAEAQVTAHAELACQIARLREEHESLSLAIATKQAILQDLEARTRALGEKRELALLTTRAAEERLASLQDQLARLLAELPALAIDLPALIRAAVAESLAAHGPFRRCSTSKRNRASAQAQQARKP